MRLKSARAPVRPGSRKMADFRCPGWFCPGCPGCLQVIDFIVPRFAPVRSLCTTYISPSGPVRDRDGFLMASLITTAMGGDLKRIARLGLPTLPRPGENRRHGRHQEDTHSLPAHRRPARTASTSFKWNVNAPFDLVSFISRDGTLKPDFTRIDTGNPSRPSMPVRLKTYAFVVCRRTCWPQRAPGVFARPSVFWGSL